MKLSAVIEELVEERGLDRSTLNTIILEGMLAAYERKYPNYTLKVERDPKTDEVLVFAQKEAVTTVDDDEFQMSLKKARAIDPNLQEGGHVWVPFDGYVGRIEILKARQVIASKIRTIEAKAIYEEFKDRQGEIVHGMINKAERTGFLVKVDDTLAFLPKSNMSPADKYIVGYPIRALLKEVLAEPRNDNQLILDRASEQFLIKIFELEIPEFFERLVEIKKAVRIPGYKSKIVVVSHDSNIDAVGAFVGVNGSRIKPILKELGVEKVDVIPYTDSPEVFVANALKPAQIDRVEVENSVARVWLDESQRSLAIGKMGQNISLAVKLTGYDIQLIQHATGDLKDVDYDESQEQIIDDEK